MPSLSCENVINVPFTGGSKSTLRFTRFHQTHLMDHFFVQRTVDCSIHSLIMLLIKLN